jgi:aminopeptidase N
LHIPFADSRIALPTQYLKDGANTVRMAFTQKYMRDGSGLFRFDDPEDGRSYVFTQFQPFYANAMFPCFDQPDLKAVLKMRVTAPADWKIVTATRESRIDPLPENRSLWRFPETPPVSTYLYSLHAGPFNVWESSAESGAGTVPLRLFARQAMKKFVVPEEWFAPTRHGMKFFGELFAYPYPFAKYDQVIAPDFTSVAMENLASVLFTEEYLHRGRVTKRDRFDRDNTILHELAHHWFGNLVTMEWWDGLWLNESFATYMATLAQAGGTAGRDAWLEFHAEARTSAYFEDQLVTTHPIAGRVPDTLSAFAVFDSITYGKGAAVLGQLSHFIGADRFREGLRAYFKTHAYKNTRLNDFVGALGKSAGRDLTGWSRDWFESAGLDTVETRFRCIDGHTTDFELHLSGPNGKPSPRSHRTTVAFYDRGSKRATGPLRVGRPVAVELRQPVTKVSELNGQPCPMLVMANEGDHGYFKMRLDSRSLATSLEQLPDVEVPLSRMIVWTSLYEMLREGSVGPQTFLEAAQAQLPREPEQRLADHVLYAAVGPQGMGFSSALQYLPSEDQGVAGLRNTWDEKIENAAWTRFANSKPGSDRQLRSLEGYVQAARTAKGAGRLADFVEGNRSAESLSLDRDRRWKMIVRASALGEPRAERLIEREKKRDKSDRAAQMALAADAARPDIAVKQAWFERLLAPKSDLSLSHQSAVMESILPEWQARLRETLAGDFYVRLPKLNGQFDQEFQEKFARAFAPTVCSTESAGRLGAFIDVQGSRLQPGPLRALKIEHQEDKRCAELRSRASRITAGESR